MPDWLWPLAGQQPGGITTPYGAPQTITGGYGNVFAGKPKNARGQPINTGVDLAAARGTPIIAIDNATVLEVRHYNPREEAAGRDSTGGYGNSVLYQLPTGERVRVSHMSTDPPFSPGERLTKGALLGAVGDTGNATGPHLDFEMQDASGQYVDPIARGNYTTGQPRAQPAQSGLQRAGGQIVRFASQLPAGVRLGVPFRPEDAQGANVGLFNTVGGVGTLGAKIIMDRLPQGMRVGQRVTTEQLAAAGVPGFAPPGAPGSTTQPMGGPNAPITGGPGGGPGGPPGGPGKPPGDDNGSDEPNQTERGATAEGTVATPQSKRDAVIQQIRQAARANGADDLADLLLAIGNAETGLDPDVPGDKGPDGQWHSWGVYHENDGGPAGKLPPEQRKDVPSATARRIQEIRGLQKQNPGLLEKDPGQLAILAQRPLEENRPAYRQKINSTIQQFRDQGRAGVSIPVGRQDGAAPAARAKSATLTQAEAGYAAAKTKRDTMLKERDDALKAVEAVNRGAADAPAAPPVGSIDPIYEAYQKQSALAARYNDPKDSIHTELRQAEENVAQTERYLAQAQDADKKAGQDNASGQVVGGAGKDQRYILRKQDDGTWVWEENLNYDAAGANKVGQLTGIGPDVEYYGLVDETGNVVFNKNPGFNPTAAYENDGRVVVYNKTTGEVLANTDTMAPEDRANLRAKAVADAQKSTADADKARLDAAIARATEAQWQKIRDAIDSGNYSPEQINTLVLQGARNVKDYTDLLTVQNARDQNLEAKRHNLAGEETETRKTRVSEQDSARQATESYGRWGLATAPWQSMLLGAQAPITDPRKLGETMKVDPNVSGPVGEQYDRQRQQQEEFQNARRATEEKANQPFFAPAPGAGVAEAGRVNAPPPTPPPTQGGTGAVAPGAGVAAPRQPTPATVTHGAPEGFGGRREPPPSSAGDTGSAGGDYTAPSPAAAPAASPAEAPAAAPATPEAPPAPEDPYPPFSPITPEQFGPGPIIGPGSLPPEDPSLVPGVNQQDPPVTGTPLDQWGQPYIPFRPPDPMRTDEEYLRQLQEQEERDRAGPTGGGGVTPWGGRFVGGGGAMLPMYVSPYASSGGGGGGGGGGDAGPPKRQRMPVPGKHILPTGSPDWVRTEYDDGAVEEWHIKDGSSWEGVGGRGAGFHGERPPTYGIGWSAQEGGSKGGGGSIWYLPPTPGVVPGMMGAPPMNQGGPVGGMPGGPTTAGPGPGAPGGMAGGFAGPAAGGGGAPPMPMPPGAPPAPMGPPPGPPGPPAGPGGAPPPGMPPEMGGGPPPPPGPVEPLTYNGGGQYTGGGGDTAAFPAGNYGVDAGAGGNPPGRAPQWDAATPAPFITAGSGGPSGVAGSATLFRPGTATGGQTSSGLPMGGGAPTPRRSTSSSGYYGGPGMPQAMTPLQRLLQQSGVTPLHAGAAAGMPGTI